MRPLDGIRVVDLSTFIAGPYAAAILGEFGAEVIKVEHPDGGDPGRRFGTPTEIPDLTLAFQSDNRNKVSVTLDLKAPADKDRLIELARRSDALIENFRPGTLEKWSLGPDVLHEANPALVICRVTGYGQDGPYRDRPGFARIAHAVGGLTHLAGMADGPPVTPGSSSLADYFSGIYGALGVLLALRTAERTGEGQSIDVALIESIFRVLDETAPAYAKFGIVRGREGRMTRNVCPHGHFECGDGKWVAIACTSDRMWERMAQNVLRRPDLAASHPRTADRLADRDLIDGTVEAFTLAHPMEEVVRLCTDGDVPCGPVNSIADIFADPHFAARGAIERVQHPRLGEIAVPATFPRLSKTPGWIDRLGPELGDWNDRLDALLADEDEVRRR
jgi:crotonobetainyl-CoA:carnitine CoA-transferase CaiB-like acyl-CoA transferase